MTIGTVRVAFASARIDGVPEATSTSGFSAASSPAAWAMPAAVP
jgi:hypothetical protein